MDKCRFLGTVRFLVLLSIMVLFVGCGGGGGGDDGGSNTGSWEGTKQLGVTGAETTPQGVAVDSSGNVYVAGYTQGGLDGNTLTGSYDFFLTKYDSSGDMQ